MTKKNSYNIAVLLPTRGRTGALTRSVKGLVNRATDPDSICIMFALDSDDKIGLKHFTDEIQPWLDEKQVSYQALEFDSLGYGRLNEYANNLATAVDADWYFLWNDDAIMETTGWDRLIANCTGEFKLLAVHTHRDHPYSIFPILPRSWVEVTGYISPHPLSDAWTSQVAYKLDIFKRIEIYVTHDRHDLTGNNKDQTFEARNLNELEGNPNNPRDFHNPKWISLRLNETEKLSRYMQSQGMDISWWINIKAGKQDPWAKLKENDVNNQMAHFSITLKK